ncbi:MAG: hypothetical protein JST91_24535 [Actinobacteria bacterium]|nr:hypothetical protein [Actinomycetota bacterium]
MAGPYPYPEHFPQHQFPPPPVAQGAPQPYPDDPASAYPGMLPPPVQYPKRRRWPAIVGALVAVAAVAGVITAVVLTSRDGSARTASGPLSDEAARTAVQGYLDALSNGDNETIARNALCGLYDDIKERRSDLALARLTGDAFRKQFSRAEVTSIDKIVPLSSNQARVLFTMRVAPAGGSTRGQAPPNDEEQGVAEILIQGSAPNQDVLVCSYLLRSGQF